MVQDLRDKVPAAVEVSVAAQETDRPGTDPAGARVPDAAAAEAAARAAVRAIEARRVPVQAAAAVRDAGINNKNGLFLTGPNKKRRNHHAGF
jgi:hypothetical protein